MQSISRLTLDLIGIARSFIDGWYIEYLEYRLECAIKDYKKAQKVAQFKARQCHVENMRLTDTCISVMKRYGK